MNRRELMAFGSLLAAAPLLVVASSAETDEVKQTPRAGTPVVASPIAEATPVALQVAIRGTVFSPGTLRISTGTKVTWTNFDMRLHTVTSSHGDYLRSGRIGPADTWSFTFKDSGSFAYLCDYHNNMDGIVIVSNP